MLAFFKRVYCVMNHNFFIYVYSILLGLSMEVANSQFFIHESVSRTHPLLGGRGGGSFTSVQIHQEALDLQ